MCSEETSLRDEIVKESRVSGKSSFFVEYYSTSSMSNSIQIEVSNQRIKF